VAIDVESLKQERDRVKESLRQIEVDSRRIEAEVKTLRQREIQAKREIDALTALIEISESRNATPIVDATPPTE
jgi:hypothetical protein